MVIPITPGDRSQRATACPQQLPDDDGPRSFL